MFACGREGARKVQEYTAVPKTLPSDRDETGPAVSLLTVRAALLVAIAASVAIWPVLVLEGRVFTFSDSAVYLEQGERIRTTLTDLFTGLVAGLDGGVGEGGGASAGAVSGLRRGAADADSVRSIPYAAFVGTLAPLSQLAIVWVQAALTMLLLYAVLATGPRHPVGGLAGLVLVVALLTPLPFVSTLMMPDLLGAAVILYGLLLVRGWDRLSGPSRILASLAVLFAVLSHYGNIPLAAAILLAAIAVLAHRGRRLVRLATIAGAVVAGALLANGIVAAIAFDEVSVTPRRFPILLARSIEDGPARWYLEDTCPEADYAVCDYWGADIPDDVGTALWGPRGMENAPSDLYDRIRAEETQVLWRAFRRYPAAQADALLGNAVRQLVLVGPETQYAGRIAAEGTGSRQLVQSRDHPLRPAGPALHPLYRAAYLVGVLALVVLAWRGGDRHRGLIVVLFVGLLANAAVFGGLSAPDGRYQARVAWLVPLLALALALETRRRRQPAPA